jgi:hypothetical protein
LSEPRGSDVGGRGEIGLIEPGYVGSTVDAGVLQIQINRFRTAWPEVDVSSHELPMIDLPILFAVAGYFAILDGLRVQAMQ